MSPSNRDLRGESSPRTVREVLRLMTDFLAARGIETGRLDAEILLAHGLGIRRIDLYVHHDRPVSGAELSGLRELLAVHGQGKPVAQITGEKEFYSLTLEVSEQVLCPRPETEVLVDVALERARKREGELLALDWGTGSGNIAIAVAHCLENVRVLALDRSIEALRVARRNVDRLGLADRVSLLAADGGVAFSLERLAGKVDLFLSNPPYVAHSDRDSVEEGVRRFEPEGAVFAGEDAYRNYRRFARSLDHLLSPGGSVIVEIGIGMEDGVTEIFRNAGLAAVEVFADLAGIPRVVAAARS